MPSFRMEYPPTINTYWRQWRGRTVLSSAGRQYREAAVGLTSDHLSGLVAVMIEVTFPDHRKRDIDNIIKPVLDAIGHAGIYDDDVQVRKLIIEEVGFESPGCIDVILERWDRP